MEDYIKRMNEEYIKKNYPERSVFKAYKKSMGSRGRTGCIIMGLFMAGGLAADLVRQEDSGIYAVRG